MRIMHVCLACFYIDDYSYQENVLPIIHKNMGHDVMILASTETYSDKGGITYVKPSKYITKEGITIERLGYKMGCLGVLAKKIRIYSGTVRALRDFRPDLIFLHDMQFVDLRVIVNYAKKNNVKVIADSHADFHNSGKNFISKYFLHRILYKTVIHKNLSYINKIYAISSEVKEFCIKEYGIPSKKIELLPLGGYIMSDNDYYENRKYIRKELGFKEDDLVLMHTGKFEIEKKTGSILKMMKEIKNKKLKLVIIGSFPVKSIENEVLKATINDKRIKYLGWKSGNDLQRYLCACDLYVQPGTQSATMQCAACLRCGLLLYPYDSHKTLFGNTPIYAKSSEDIIKGVNRILLNNNELDKMRRNVFKVAKTMLNYTQQAKKIITD